MVRLEPSSPIRFAGSEAPAAFLSLKSIGLPRSLNAVSGALTQLMGEHFGVPAERVFIQLESVLPTHWAHAGETFAS